MPNVFVAEGLTQLSGAFIAGLYDSGVLLGTVWRDAESSLIGGRGDSVTIRAPQLIPAINFVAPAVPTDVNEGKLQVVLDQEPYNQTIPTAKEMTLAVEDVAAQLINPQVAGVAEYIDESIATALEGTGGTATGASWREAVAAAYGVLGANKVPTADRWLAVAPDVAGSLLTDTVFVSASDRGDNGDALNDAILGRLYGFNVVTSASLTPGAAIAFHTTAVAAVFRLQNAPLGGVTVGSSSFNGISAQVLYGFDNSKLADVLTVRSLYGLGTGDDFDKRALKLTVAVGP